MREISAGQLMETVTDPFVRHQIDPQRVQRVWCLGDAVVVQGGRAHRATPDGPVLTGLGAAEDLVPLMAEVDSVLGQRPGRFAVDAAARPGLPRRWQFPDLRTWSWMWTTDRPTATLRHPVEEATDAAEIDAVLDVAMPSSHARPHSRGIETWLGVRHDGRLVGVGALERMPDGTGHLRGICVLPGARGDGIGGGISHALTLRALDGRSGVATLGVYSDNESAIGLYETLGFAERHRFCSGGPAPAAGGPDAARRDVAAGSVAQGSG